MSPGLLQSTARLPYEVFAAWWFSWRRVLLRRLWSMIPRSTRRNQRLSGVQQAGLTTNHLTRHFSIDLMPQSRHKKARFSPKGDECEPQCIAKSPGQIGRFSPQEFIQKKAGTHRSTDRFQVLRLV
jgi:hypothetical protein